MAAYHAACFKIGEINMCGIVGYTGSRPAAPILLAGLSHLEYRGYDSAGLAVREGGGEIEIVKTRGPIGVGKAVASV